MSRIRYIFAYRGNVWWGRQALVMLDKQYLNLVGSIPKLPTVLNDRIKYMFKHLPHGEGYNNYFKVMREPRMAKGLRSIYVSELRRLGFSRPKRKNATATTAYRFDFTRQAQAPRNGVRGQGNARG